MLPNIFPVNRWVLGMFGGAMQNPVGDPRGHELLSIIIHYVLILLSTLESYRFCPLIRHLVSLTITR
jgi:hypothetical protein